MISLKKSLEEYVYEFLHSILVNSPLPDDEELITSQTSGDNTSVAIDETSQTSLLRSIAFYLRQQMTGDQATGLRGQTLPKTGILLTKESIKVFVSPRFPNNVFLPSQLSEFKNNQFFQIFFALWVSEKQNGNGVVIDRLVRRRFIFVLPTRNVREETTQSIISYIRSEIENDTFSADVYGYPYFTEIPILKIGGTLPFIPPRTQK